jgi:hypothetical protein
MRQSKSNDSVKRDEKSRREKAIQVALDPTASLSLQKSATEDQGWIEDQVEDPERWDGLS